MTPEEILAHIRTVVNFPKEGVLFKDITTALKDPRVFEAIIDNLYNLVKEIDFDYVVAIESRGYLLGAPLAYKMKKGLVIIRKPGKLPSEVIREEYSLEYGIDAIEIHKDAIEKSKKVLIIDDVLATGGTATAACNLIKKAQGQIVGLLFLMELKALSQHAKFDAPVYSLIKC